MRQPPMIPIKPSIHPTVAHGTKESLDAQNIPNPARNVIWVPKVERIVCGMINNVASRFG